MNKKGVTIVEVIITSLLLMFSVGGILALSVQNIRLSKVSDYYYVAVNLAKNRIERIREIRWEKGLDYLQYLTEEGIYINRDGNSDPNGDFVRTTEIDTGYGTNLVKVTVKVNYEIMQILRPQPVELVTVVTNKEYLGL